MRARRRIEVCAALFAAGLFAAGLWAQPRALDLESFDVVWQTVRDTHWQAKPGGLDWEAMRSEYRPRVEKAATAGEARAAIAEMLRRLGQTHFAIVPGTTASLGEGDAAGPATPGVEVRVLDGEAVVTRVEPGSSAQRSGVHAGWIVKSARGRELKALIGAASKNPTIHELQLTRLVEGALSGGPGESLDVTFVDGSGAESALRLTLGVPRGERTEFGNLPAMYVWYEDRRIGQVGYVRFNAFLDIPRLMPAFQKTVTECLKCKGLILDLRGNPGGIAGMATGMAGFFVEKTGQQLGTMYTRDTALKYAVNPRPEVFAGPVAVLVDGTSASTAEVFAGGLQDLGRAKVFGTRSAGAALPSIFTPLPNGDGFQYAVANYVSAGGKPLEGEGVHPNVEVRPTRQELLAGRDSVIEAAVMWIEEQK